MVLEDVNVFGRVWVRFRFRIGFGFEKVVFESGKWRESMRGRSILFLKFLVIVFFVSLR